MRLKDLHMAGGISDNKDLLMADGLSDNKDLKNDTVGMFLRDRYTW